MNIEPAVAYIEIYKWIEELMEDPEGTRIPTDVQKIISDRLGMDWEGVLVAVKLFTMHFYKAHKEMTMSAVQGAFSIGIMVGAYTKREQLAEMNEFAKDS